MLANYLSRLTAQLSLAAIVFTGFCPGVPAAGLELERRLDLGAWSPFAMFWEADTPICAWTDTDDTGYRIVASSHDLHTGFRLVNEIGTSILYSVFWLSNQDSLSGEQLRAGVPSAQVYPFTQGVGCDSRPHNAMRIQVDKADFDSAIPGTYSGVLLLTLTPI